MCLETGMTVRQSEKLLAHGIMVSTKFNNAPEASLTHKSNLGNAKAILMPSKETELCVLPLWMEPWLLPAVWEDAYAWSPEGHQSIALLPSAVYGDGAQCAHRCLSAYSQPLCLHNMSVRLPLCEGSDLGEQGHDPSLLCLILKQINYCVV